MAAEKVVYLLGAGFSAPLGLPVMAKFVSVSRRVQREKPEACGYFQGIFDMVKNLDTALRRYKVDLDHIEDVLSLLDMKDFLTGESHSEAYARYIKDVISACTPAYLQPGEPGPRGKQEFPQGLFASREAEAHKIGFFVASLLNLAIRAASAGAGRLEAGRVSSAAAPKCEYAIVTLNYDLVIENALKYIVDHLPPMTGAKASQTLRIAKLHGSVDGVVVPPTWHKRGIEKVEEHWKLAFTLLSEAQHIRVLGYSLPPADMNVRHLLHAAAAERGDLETFHVVDRDHDLAQRYVEFVKSDRLAFAAVPMEEYLERVMKRAFQPARASPGVDCTHIEDVHRLVMQEKGVRLDRITRGR